jgi:uncharacterized protein
MMAKRPVPGRVKTRLAVSIGQEAAAEVSRILIDSLMFRLAPCGDRRVLATSPDDETQTMCQETPTELSRPWIWRGQGSGDLGSRMKRQFEWEMAFHPSSRVVMVGSDLPSISPQDIAWAFDQLDGASDSPPKDVVLGPARDGGYWLIGLVGPWRPHYDSLFVDMTWSTDTVFEETARRASAQGLQIGTLDTREDIDTVEALNRFVESNTDVSLQVALSAALDPKN